MPNQEPDASQPEFHVHYFRRACSEAGLRTTHQRLKIYQALASSEDHPSAQMLFDALRRDLPTISLDTVYRTLTTFEAHGLARRVRATATLARFESSTTRHHHFICTACGVIIDFNWPAFDQNELPACACRLGSVRERSVTLSGICSRCLTERDGQ